jgi:peroxiredoxin
MEALTPQLDAFTAQIPPAIGTRMDAGIEEVRKSGAAPGLSVGESAPDFSLLDARGERIVLSELLANGPVVVTFYRGEWCPYCNMQLRALPQAPDHGLTLSEKNELAFAVLSDLDQSVSESFKVRFEMTGELEDLHVNVFQNDPALQNADGRRSLPVPSTFVIDRDGVVRFASVNADWRVRTEPAEVIAALTSL